MVLQTVRKLCEPTSEWFQYARQIAEHQPVDVVNTHGDENQLNDANEHMLMTTRC